jgi:hypothetical protein
MKKRLLVILTVLLVHTAAAHAQQSPITQDPGTTAAEAYPPGYAPPPGFSPPAPPPAPPPPPAYGAPPPYGPPPRSYGGSAPGYGTAPPPYYGPRTWGGPPGRYQTPNYYYYSPPPPPREITDRPFTLGGGLGFGGLTFRDAATGRATATDGMSYTFRLGFGLRPGLILMWDLEGAIVKPTGAATATAQTANLAALQIFATRRLFLKAGFGFAQVVQDEHPRVWGGAGMVGIGYELIQGWNWSFDIEATATGARYDNNGAGENWTNWSLVNFAINFF